MSHDDQPVRLKAFVGRSFREEDEKLWNDFRAILDALKPIGFDYEDAVESQLRPISEKIKQRIHRNDIYIGILPRRMAVHSPLLKTTFLDRVFALFEHAAETKVTAWTTSEWVIQEIGYALGRDKKTLVLIEEGVLFPVTDLDADTQWIQFNRDKIEACHTQLVSMISGLIGSSLSQYPTNTTTTADTSRGTAVVQQEDSTKQSTFFDLRDLAQKQEFEKFDTCLETLLEDESYRESEKFFRLYALRLKYKNGHDLSLKKLIEIVQQEPSNEDGVNTLVEAYKDFKNYSEAITLLRNTATIVGGDLKINYLTMAIAIQITSGDLEGVENEISSLLSSTTNPVDKAKLYSLGADLAKVKNDMPQEIASLEACLALTPNDQDHRFRLAWLYDENKQNQLAAYHYKLLNNGKHNSLARNNIAFVYERLGLIGKRGEQLLIARDDCDLAKANLAVIYTDAGLFDEAQKIASEILANTKDDHVRSRATYAIEEISAQNKKAESLSNNLYGNTQDIRQFLSDFGIAYFAKTLPPGSVNFSLKNTNVALGWNQGLINGKGHRTIPVRPLLAGLSLTNLPLPPSEPRIETTELSGQISGRAGRLKILTSIDSENHLANSLGTSTLLGGTPSQALNTLLIINEDLKEVRFLVLTDDEWKVVTQKTFDVL